MLYWERIKRSESYDNITSAQLKEVLEYKDSIEIKLEIERELAWNNWLENTEEGKAYSVAPKLHDELTEIRLEMDRRRENHKIKKINKYAKEHNIELVKKIENESTKQQLFNKVLQRATEKNIAEHVEKYLTVNGNQGAYDFLAMIEVEEEPVNNNMVRKSISILNNYELLDRYNDIIKSFRLKGINLKDE
jgi:hypothetical protein